MLDSTRLDPVHLLLPGGHTYAGVSVGSQCTQHCFPGYGVAFDVGLVLEDAVNCENIFITHGHYDHWRAAIDHIYGRANAGFDPATYYVPGSKVNDFYQMVQAHAALANTRAFENTRFVAMKPGDRIPVGKGGHHSVVAHRGHHTVAALGYSLERKTKRLKPEFDYLPKEAIISMKRGGVPVEEEYTSVDVFYPGDTTKHVFDDIRKLKPRAALLECTFLEADPSPADAIRSGHLHIEDILKGAADGVFDDVEHIVFTHFSARYRSRFISRIVSEKIAGTSIAGKVSMLVRT